jgi:hypothetical protein
MFKNNGDMTCTSPVDIFVKSMTCDDSEFCHFGDVMDVNGLITLEENLPAAEMCVTTQACFMGVSFMCKTSNETINVCNALGVSDSNDGTACPNAGTFYFGSTVQIPGKWNMNLGTGKS